MYILFSQTHVHFAYSQIHVHFVYSQIHVYFVYSQIHVHFVQSNTCTFVQSGTCTFCSAKYMYLLFSQIHIHFVQSSTCTFCLVKYMYSLLIIKHMYSLFNQIRVHFVNSQIHVYFVKHHYPYICKKNLKTPKGQPQSVITSRIFFLQFIYFHFKLGPSWSWEYGSWIYNYLCYQCLPPLMLRVQISIKTRCTTLCDKVCQWLSTGRWFSPGPPPIKLTATL
jgi:hypothetical protein